MTPPLADELELSLFGSGVGECAVLHLGDGEWMVVDSCTPSRDGAPVALTYLQSIGVDISSQVKLVVVTHWHDDHIAGLAELLRQADNAKFGCSAALRCKEFLTLVAGDREVNLIEQSSGVQEFSSVLDVLAGRATQGRAQGPDLWATEGSRLYLRDGQIPIEVCALSPSAQTVTDGHRSLADIVPSAGQPIRRFRHPNPNDLSVVLKVCTPSIQFLLGGDLESNNSTRHGWRAVLASTTVPKGRAAVYKVAHHGSENADLPEIWQNMLEQQPYGVLTAYAKGRKPRPSPDDVQRMKERTNHLYCTTWPATKSPKSRAPAVARTMKETVLSHRAVPNTMGHIQLRVPQGGGCSEVEVLLFGGAKRL